MNIYDFKVLDKNNKEVSLSEFKGKTLLIFNSATHCGFTPTLDELEKLYEKYHSKGLELLEFPCNQFKEQAPESIGEIDHICSLKFNTKYLRFNKVDVNGENASPLFKYLEENTTFEGFDPKHELTPILNDLMKEMGNDKDKHSIKWNFTKFLISKEGNIFKRYEPTTPISEIDKDLDELLK